MSAANEKSNKAKEAPPNIKALIGEMASAITARNFVDARRIAAAALAIDARCGVVHYNLCCLAAVENNLAGRFGVGGGGGPQSPSTNRRRRRRAIAASVFFLAALESLKQALDVGYAKFDVIYDDADLEALRATADFAFLMAKYDSVRCVVVELVGGFVCGSLQCLVLSGLTT